MSLGNPFNPKAGNDSVVDALIGSAYEVVKYVAYYVKEIRYVAFNMEHVYAVSQNMYKNAFKVQTMTNRGQDYTFTLPEGVTAGMILNIAPTVLTSAGAIYGPSPANFSWVLGDGVIIVNIPGDAPEAFVGASLRCLINWQSPVVVTE